MSAESTTPREGRPSILDALLDGSGRRRHAVLEASAGTGKTHTLEHLVVDLLLEGTPIDRILVVTFTEKATAEMRQRIRARVAALVAAGHAPLRAALADFDRAPISTIHAFCQRVLSEHAFASGRLFEQERVAPREAFGRAFREALRRGLVDGATERPLLDAALADTSPAVLEKTLWAWHRERGRVEPAFDPSTFAALLASIPPAAEIDTTGRALLGGGGGVRREALRATLLGLSRVADQVRAGASIEAVSPMLFAWGAQKSAPSAKKTDAQKLAEALAAQPFGAALAALVAAVSSPYPALVHTWLPSIQQRLAEDKRRRGRFDFDDMLVLVRDALDGPGGPALVASLRARYAHALVDEFQDTDPVQWEIFRRVFFESPSHTLTVIGDPKQAIYGFRNADVHTYLAARDRIVAAGGARAPLTGCFRSTPGVVDAVNTLLAGDFFHGANEYPHPVTCGRPWLRAIEPDGSEGASCVLLHLAARAPLAADPLRRAHAAEIAREIRRLLDGGLRVTDRDDPTRSLRALRPDDIYVLTHTRGEAADVADALAHAGIPHALGARRGLFESPEAADVLAVLEALEDPSSRPRRMKAWLTPFFAALPADLDACATLAPEHPFHTRLTRWAELAAAGRFAALFHAMVDESGIARRHLFLRDGERELTNVLHVLELLTTWASRDRHGLRGLVAALRRRVEVDEDLRESDDEDQQRLESERASVQVLTMHSSKGLEAEVVFLFGGLVARSRSANGPRVFHRGAARAAWLGAQPPAEVAALVADETRQEQERLMYVALTRARSRVYLAYVGEGSLPSGLESTFGRLDGAHAVVNQRLAALVAAGQVEDASRDEDASSPQVPASSPQVPASALLRGPSGAPLFVRRVVLVGAASRRVGMPPPLPGLAPAGASVDPAFPALLPSDRFERLAGAARAPETTSYTRMKQAAARLEASDPTPADEPAAVAERALDPTPPPDESVARRAPDPLPAGTTFGVFVHEILEHLDPALARAAPDADALWGSEVVRSIIDEAALRQGIAPEVCAPTASLVHAALRTEIVAPGLSLPGGFAAPTRRAVELSFLHPIPERAHPAFEAVVAGASGPLSVERGFVRGVIDLLFEHEGKTWVLDWKTDRLPSYDPATLAAHAEAHYEIQARLYALGVARMLRLRDARDHEARFGGLVYCFVRGLGAPGEGGQTPGIHVMRPDFDTLAAWDRALRESDTPWGHPLPPPPGRHPAEEASR